MNRIRRKKPGSIDRKLEELKLIGKIDVNELVKDETKKKSMIDIILENNNKNKNYKKNSRSRSC